MTWTATHLRLEDQADVDVDVFNAGHLEVVSPIGGAEVRSFTQTATGTYQVEIDGISENDFLRIADFILPGLLQVGGTLDVLVNDNGGAYADPFTAGASDWCELIEIENPDPFVDIGTCETFVYDDTTLTLTLTSGDQDFFHAGDGLFRILDYGVSGISLINYRALPGDANIDGVVDGSDFGIWNANKFTSGTDWTTGDFNGDGVTDGSDFGIWNSNTFTSTASVSTGPFESQTVPEPVSLILPGMAVMLMFVARRRMALGTAMVPAAGRLFPVGPFVCFSVSRRGPQHRNPSRRPIDARRPATGNSAVGRAKRSILGRCHHLNPGCCG